MKIVLMPSGMESNFTESAHGRRGVGPVRCLVLVGSVHCVLRSPSTLREICWKYWRAKCKLNEDGSRVCVVIQSTEFKGSPLGVLEWRAMDANSLQCCTTNERMQEQCSLNTTHNINSPNSLTIRKKKNWKLLSDENRRSKSVWNLSKSVQF